MRDHTREEDLRVNREAARDARLPRITTNRIANRLSHITDRGSQVANQRGPAAGNLTLLAELARIINRIESLVASALVHAEKATTAAPAAEAPLNPLATQSSREAAATHTISATPPTSALAAPARAAAAATTRSITLIVQASRRAAGEGGVTAAHIITTDLTLRDRATDIITARAGRASNLLPRR